MRSSDWSSDVCSSDLFLLAGCSNRYDLMGRIPGVVDVEHYARGHLGSVRTELVDQRRLQPYQHAPQYSVADAMSSLAWLALAPRSCVGLTSLLTEPTIRLERLPTKIGRAKV